MIQVPTFDSKLIIETRPGVWREDHRQAPHDYDFCTCLCFGNHGFSRQAFLSPRCDATAAHSSCLNMDLSTPNLVSTAIETKSLTHILFIYLLQDCSPGILECLRGLSSVSSLPLSMVYSCQGVQPQSRPLCTNRTWLPHYFPQFPFPYPR